MSLDSFYFHTKQGRDVLEHWMTAVPGNYTPYENRLKLVVDAGLSGLGLWSVKKIDYASENELEVEFNQNMWGLFKKYGKMIKPKAENPFVEEEYINNMCREFWDRYVKP